MRIGICSDCGEIRKLVIHHIDGNPYNNVPSNRILICYRCHLVTHGRADRGFGKPPRELAPEEYPPMPPVEIKRQYEAYFPRA